MSSTVEARRDLGLDTGAWVASCRDTTLGRSRWGTLADLIRDGNDAAALVHQAAGLVLVYAQPESAAAWQELYAAVRAWDGRDLKAFFEGPRRDVWNAMAEVEGTGGNPQKHTALVTADLLLEAVKSAARLRSLRQSLKERVTPPIYGS
jgi:hypothetical protein